MKLLKWLALPFLVIAELTLIVLCAFSARFISIDAAMKLADTGAKFPDWEWYKL